MIRIVLAGFFLSLLGMAVAAAAESDTRLYEMRVYWAAPGKLDALHARFRDHTTKLFAKHGMTNVGYFVPVGDNPERKLVYFLAYPDRKARDASWAAFVNDPEWKAAHAASEKDGKLVEKATETFMTTTDYSPALDTKPEIEAERIAGLSSVARRAKPKTTGVHTTTAGSAKALPAVKIYSNMGGHQPCMAGVALR